MGYTVGWASNMATDLVTLQAWVASRRPLVTLWSFGKPELRATTADFEHPSQAPANRIYYMWVLSPHTYIDMCICISMYISSYVRIPCEHYSQASASRIVSICCMCVRTLRYMRVRFEHPSQQVALHSLYVSAYVRVHACMLYTTIVVHRLHSTACRSMSICVCVYVCIHMCVYVCILS